MKFMGVKTLETSLMKEMCQGNHSKALKQKFPEVKRGLVNYKDEV